ncbi:hypothetical protein WR25_04604 [Diploscapter pachys]|uniref:Uncharacterized protein n=1 Tax=Diploscapter pachys TaxID=2018661 RepID=A0A2A2LKZ3_9BILA|nr:hypothetical protein WR25_04604 [Diploscapter pachys]
MWGEFRGLAGGSDERTLCFERRRGEEQTSQLKERDSPARSCRSQKRTTGREEKTVDAFLAIAVVGLSGSAGCAPIVLSQVSCTLPQASDSFPFAAVFFSSISTRIVSPIRKRLTSSSLSPNPSMMEVFVMTAELVSFANFSAASDCLYLALGSRTQGTDRPRHQLNALLVSVEIGQQTLNQQFGFHLLQLLHCLGEMRGSSIRNEATALAVFSGSIGSSGGGLLAVLTEQNRHPLVQVSPMSMIVAVDRLPSSCPPPQHSPKFGHLASSQTVASLSPFSCFFSLATLSFMLGRICNSFHPTHFIAICG